MSYSTLRIGGLASGLDVDQMVSDLMKAERLPLDKLQQTRQLWAWKQEDYRTMNTALASLKDLAFSMKLQSYYQARQATISDSTVATASAGASAANGSYSLEVVQLAKGVQVMSGTVLPEEANSDGSTKSLADQFGLAAGQDVSFTIEGAQKSSGGYTTASIDINTTTDNINTLVSKINSAQDADGTSLGLQASYDATYNRLVVVSKITGADQHFQITSDASVLLADGITPANLWADELVVGAGPYDGLDASFKIAGSTDTLTSASNTVTVLGLTLTFNKTNSGSPVTINVTTDVDTVYDKIKSLVDKYNETVAKVYDELNEARYRDYSPLTDEQKKDMQDSDIDLWTEKARSGMLRNDAILSDILTKVRRVMNEKVQGLAGVDTLGEIGITTGQWWEGGKLVIDEAKLRKAVGDDPDAVQELFANSSDVTEENGLAIQLYDELDNGIKRLSDYAGTTSSYYLVDQSYMGKELGRYDERVAEMQDRLKQIEDRYWRQFTALEQALSRMNTQSAWLAQQFGGSSN